MTAPVGGACSAVNQSCAAGYYCSLGDDAGGCVPVKPVGAFCESYTECADGCLVVFGAQRCIGRGTDMCHG